MAAEAPERDLRVGWAETIALLVGSAVLMLVGLAVLGGGHGPIFPLYLFFAPASLVFPAIGVVGLASETLFIVGLVVMTLVWPLLGVVLRAVPPASRRTVAKGILWIHHISGLGLVGYAIVTQGVAPFGNTLAVLLAFPALVIYAGGMGVVWATVLHR